MKKIILIVSLLMASGLWAEQMVCGIVTGSYNDIDDSVENIPDDN